MHPPMHLSIILCPFIFSSIYPGFIHLSISLPLHPSNPSTHTSIHHIFTLIHLSSVNLSTSLLPLHPSSPSKRFIYLSTHQPSTYSSIHLFICPSVTHPPTHPTHTHPTIHSPTHPFTHPSTYPSIHLSIHLSIHHPSSTYPPIHPFIHSPTQPFIYPSPTHLPLSPLLP